MQATEGLSIQAVAQQLTFNASLRQSRLDLFGLIVDEAIANEATVEAVVRSMLADEARPIFVRDISTAIRSLGLSAEVARYMLQLLVTPSEGITMAEMAELLSRHSAHGPPTIHQSRECLDLMRRCVREHARQSKLIEQARELAHPMNDVGGDLPSGI